MVDLLTIIAELEKSISKTPDPSIPTDNSLYLIENRIIGLRVPRGVGKTTSLFKKLIESHSILFVSNSLEQRRIQNMVRHEIKKYVCISIEQPFYSNFESDLFKTFAGVSIPKLKYILLDEISSESQVYHIVNTLQRLSIIDSQTIIIQLYS